MTTEQKLQHFLEVAVKDASNQSESMVSDYQKAQDSLFDSHKKDAYRQAELQIKVEKEKARRDVNKELSKEQLHIKRKITRKQNELKEKLFQEVEALVKDYRQTSEYESLLIQEINDAKQFAGNQIMTVYIDPFDIDKKETLEKATGVTLTVSEYSFIGGIRAVISDKNILFDKSFVSLIAEAKENFIFGGNTNE